MYVIMKGTLYVTNPGAVRPYTNQLQYARRFFTRDEARREKHEDETIVPYN